jgi:anti-anti-sigma factor
MNINCEQLDEDVYKINLEGRMDLLGNQEIELKFVSMTSSPRKFIIVDLSLVDFMASIGIRTLLVNAKAVNGRNGKYVILNPSEIVEKILLMAGIDTLIPIFKNLELAIAAVHQAEST